MIGHLRGTVQKFRPGEVHLDVLGVGYRVEVPLNAWDELKEGEISLLWISTYVREDRLELFGFLDASTRTLFEEFIQLSGIGPRMGLELCAVPRGLIAKAVQEQDASLLTSIKGIGKKTAEKLLLELRSLTEREPHILLGSGGEHQALSAKFDQDTIAALSQLGYSSPDIMKMLEKLPDHLKTTEERVTAALRSS